MRTSIVGLFVPIVRATVALMAGCGGETRSLGGSIPLTASNVPALTHQTNGTYRGLEVIPPAVELIRAG